MTNGNPMMSENTEINRDKIEYLNEAALLLSKAGEDDRSLVLLRESLKLDPEYAPSHVLLGLTHQSLGNITQAEEQFRKALEINQYNKEALHSLGLLFISSERIPEGIELLQTYIHQWANWDDSDTIKALANAYLKSSMEDEASSLLETAWRKSGDPEIGKQFGYHLLFIKSLPDQAEIILKWVANKTKDPDDYILLGTIYNRNGRYKEAIAILKEGIECVNIVELAEAASYDEYLDSGEEWPIVKDVDVEQVSTLYYLLAENYFFVNEGERALSAINSADSYTEYYDLDIKKLKIAILILLENFKEGLEIAEQAIKFIDDDNEYAEKFRQDFFQLKYYALMPIDENEAINTLKTSVEEFTGSESNYVKLTDLLAEKKEYEDAIHYYEKAIRSKIGIKNNTFIKGYVRALTKISRTTFPEDSTALMLEEMNEEEFTALSKRLIPEISDEDIVYDSFLQQVHNNYPKNITINLILAHMKIRQGLFPEAEKKFENALSINPSSLEKQYILCGSGYVYLLQGKLDHAEAAFNDVLILEDEGKSELLDGLLNIAFFKMGEIVPDHIKDTCRIYNPIVVAQANLSTIALSQDNTDIAHTSAMKILSIEGEQCLGYELLGFIYHSRKQDNASIEAWKMAEKMTPDKKTKIAIQGLLSEIGYEPQENRK
ncbi:tetratricopeptide repeat protein [Chloroflexota bacterium]